MLKLGSLYKSNSNSNCKCWCVSPSTVRNDVNMTYHRCFQGQKEAQIWKGTYKKKKTCMITQSLLKRRNHVVKTKTTWEKYKGSKLWYNLLPKKRSVIRSGPLSEWQSDQIKSQAQVNSSWESSLLKTFDWGAGNCSKQENHPKHKADCILEGLLRTDQPKACGSTILEW